MWIHLTATGGSFPTLTSGTSTQTTRSGQKQIDSLTRTLACPAKNARKVSSFAMEQAQSRFHSEASSLSRAFNYNSSK